MHIIEEPDTNTPYWKQSDTQLNKLIWFFALGLREKCLNKNHRLRLKLSNLFKNDLELISFCTL